jgi:hypothetical protein
LISEAFTFAAVAWYPNVELYLVTESLKVTFFDDVEVFGVM